MVADDAARRARRSVQGGGALYVVFLLVLSLGAELPLLDLLFLPALLFLLPALSIAQLPLVEGEPVERIPAYVGSAAGILLLGVVSLALGVRLTGADGLGLQPPSAPLLLAWSIALTGAGLAIMEGFYRYERWRGHRGSRILRELLPRTRGERGAFVGLSFAAGTGEEVAYRGYAIVALASLGLSPLAAAVGSSTAFGFLHAYQGSLGIVRTGLLGFVLALSFLATGSLWPAMVAHVAIDLVGGLRLGRRWVGAPLAGGEAEG